LANLNIRQEVSVKIDAGDDMKSYPGEDYLGFLKGAEFTLKVIQTKEERVNLVYAGQGKR